jgi:hypothetical protein
MYNLLGRSRWLYTLRCSSAAAQLLGRRVRIPLSEWMFFSCVYCVGSGLCDKLIARSEFPIVCVCVCMWSRNLNNGAAQVRVGPLRHRKKKIHWNNVQRPRLRTYQTSSAPYHILPLRFYQHPLSKSFLHFSPLHPLEVFLFTHHFSVCNPFPPPYELAPTTQLGAPHTTHLFSFILRVSSFSLRSYSLGPDSSSLLYNFSFKLKSV